jgi:hypothetical protein
MIQSANLGPVSSGPYVPSVRHYKPLGTAFQFRADSPDKPLKVIAVTLPPWPDDSADQARPEEGPWTPTLWP